MEEIIDILHKKLRNESFSQDEESRFALWISSGANQEIFEDYKKIWSVTGFKTNLLRPNVNLQWEKFKTLRNNSQNSNLKIRRIYRTISSIAAIAILFVGIGVAINSVKKSVITYTAESSSIEIQLPDNSMVFLNKNSTLVVSKKFNERTRTVKLEGEALFEVEKNQAIPFIVEMQSGILVKVLGTKFNLRANDDLSLFELNVLAGTVLFEKDENSVVVEKGEAVNYNDATNSFSKPLPLDKNLLAWHTKTFEFDNTPIHEVAISLERFINKTIEMPQDKSDIRYTGTFNDPSEKEIAEVLSLAMGWDYKIDKNKIIFTSQKPLN